MKVREKLNIKKIDIFISITIFIITLTIIFLKIFSARSNEYLQAYAINQTKNIAESLILQAVYNITKENDIENKDIVITNKNEENKIIDIDFNNVLINNYLYTVSEAILENLEKLESGNINDMNLNYYKSDSDIYFIPSGLIFNVPFVTNITPKIPFKITPIGNVQTNLKTNINEYGINNSLLELIIDIKIELRIIYPFISQEVIIEKSIPIVSKLIQGEIPSYYGGLISTSYTTSNEN